MKYVKLILLRMLRFLRTKFGLSFLICMIFLLTLFLYIKTEKDLHESEANHELERELHQFQERRIKNSKQRHKNKLKDDKCYLPVFTKNILSPTNITLSTRICPQILDPIPFLKESLQSDSQKCILSTFQLQKDDKYVKKPTLTLTLKNYMSFLKELKDQTFEIECDKNLDESNHPKNLTKDSNIRQSQVFINEIYVPKSSEKKMTNFNVFLLFIKNLSREGFMKTYPQSFSHLRTKRGQIMYGYQTSNNVLDTILPILTGTNKIAKIFPS